MTNLNTIPGIGKSSLELLEAAGFADVESLARAGLDELANELERANAILQISKRVPLRSSVEKWIASARDLTGVSGAAPIEVRMPVNHEVIPKVASMLAVAPFAIPLPARFLVEQQVAVGDIPAAILLNRYSGDLEVKIDEQVPKPGRAAVPSSNVRIAENSVSRREIDISRVKSTDSMTDGTVRPVTVRPVDEDDRVALIRGPRMETNLGRDPQSRRYIRGVMHGYPIRMALGAVVTLMVSAMLPAAIISSLLLLLSEEVPKHFGWVPEWLLVFPLSLPLFGLLYLIWGIGCSCRVCGQKIFAPRMCLKNAKAHHITGLGHIIPVCLHMLLFKWFRCTYCGTPIRLKK
jgi:hypothetical protein